MAEEVTWISEPRLATVQTPISVKVMYDCDLRVTSLKAHRREGRGAGIRRVRQCGEAMHGPLINKGRPKFTEGEGET